MAEKNLEQMKEAVAEIREKMAAAAREAGRDPASLGRNRCRRSRCVQNGLAYLRRICFFCVTMTWIILSG